MILGGA
jgi:hypothetical protein